MIDKPAGFCQSGESETVKAAAHALLGATALGCLAYNIGAYLSRTSHRRHLALNATLYGSLVGYEIYLMCHHWRAR